MHSTFEDAPTQPSFSAFLGFWLRFGCINFGGPAGQIAMMQAELVDRRRWIDQTRFLHGVNFCMLLPGPEAQQLATFIGWRMFGNFGGLAAGLLFLLPGALLLWLLSWVAAAHGEQAWVAAIFAGVKPMVVAIVAAALWRIGRRNLNSVPPFLVAAAAFVGLYWFAAPFPLIILTAGLVGIAAARTGKVSFAAAHPSVTADTDALPTALPPLSRSLKLAVIFSLLWLGPVATVIALFGTEPFADIAALFTKAAFVTFGGAYAVLPYIAEAAVTVEGWLSPSDMLNGLALAESTPGPLILVTQYVGFFAGWNNPGSLSPFWAASLASLLTLYVTFLPCFFFIFAGAPYIEPIIRNRAAASALAAIAAAVVGVILNLGVFLASHVLMPTPGQLDGFALVLMAAGLLALLRANLAVHWLVLIGAIAGLTHALAMGRLV